MYGHDPLIVSQNKRIAQHLNISRRPEGEVSQGWLPLLLHTQELQVLRVQQGVVAQQGLQGDREPPAQEDCPDPDPLRNYRLPRGRHLGHAAAPTGISGATKCSMK